MQGLPPPLPGSKKRRPAPPTTPVPRRVWVVLGVLACVGLATLLLLWRGLVRRELDQERVLLSRVAATMAAPAFARDAGETGLENRFVWALGVRAKEMHTTPERLERRLGGFGDRVWGDIGESAYDNALKALAHRRTATALERALTAAHANAPIRERREAQMLAGHLLASSFLSAQDGETPARLYRAARDLCDREFEPLAWSEAQAYLGEALRAQAKGEEARAHLDEAIAVREKALGASDPSLQRWILCRGSVSANRPEAIPFFERGLALQSAGGDLTPRETQHVLQECGRFLFQLDRFAEAKEYLAQAIGEGETIGPAGEFELAKALSDFGSIDARLHHAAQAEMLLLRALALTEKTAGPRKDEVMHPLLGLSEAKLEQQDWPAAESYAQRALAVAQGSRATDHAFFIARACDVLADVMRRSDRPIEAETYLRRGLAATEEFEGPESLKTAAALNGLALNLNQQRRRTEAERLLRRAVAIEDKLLPPEDPQRGTGLGNLGLLVAMAGRPEEGEILLRRALAFFDHLPEPVSAVHATYMDYLGDVYMMQGRKEEAGQYYKNALGMIARVQAKHHYSPPETKQIVENFATHLTKIGVDQATATQRADAMFQQALDGWQKYDNK